MPNADNNTYRPLTIRDEVAFAKEAEITVESVNPIEMYFYKEEEGLSIHHLRRDLEHGGIAAKQNYKLNTDLTQRLVGPAPCAPDFSQCVYDEIYQVRQLRSISDDVLLRRYYHSCLAGENLLGNYLVIRDLDRGTPDGSALWDKLCREAFDRGVLPICQRHAKLAHDLAMGAALFYRDNVYDGGMDPEGRRIFYAGLVLRAEKVSFRINLKMIIDQVAWVSQSGICLVTDFKTIGEPGEAAVLRQSASSKWAMKAFVTDLIASGHMERPSRLFYVVSSVSDLSHRRYEVSADSFQQGKEMFLRAAYRSHFQNIPDDDYLRTTSL